MDVRFSKINNSNFKTKGYPFLIMSITNNNMDKLLALLETLNPKDIDTYIKEQSKLKTNQLLYSQLDDSFYESITALNKLHHYFHFKYLYSNTNTTTPTVEKEEIFTYDTASEFLKVNKKTVRNWVNKESLPVIQIGANPRIKKTQLLQWLDNHNKSIIN